MNTRRLILVGATGVGKSLLAMAVARQVAGVEIVNADSRQVIYGLDIATAKPDAAARAQVSHHLYDVREPGERFSVAAWLALANQVLMDIGGHGGRAVVVGGTGLYIDALLNGLDPLSPPDLTARRHRTFQTATLAGHRALVEELRLRDPEAIHMIDVQNPRRVIRALEILDTNPGTLADVWTRRNAPRPPLDAGVTLLGLDVDRQIHARWIAARTATMFAGGGLVAEVRRTMARGLDREAIGASGIGYAEALALDAGEIDLDLAIAATVQRTLRYAKAQRTYFRRDSRIVWLDAARPLTDLTAEVCSKTGWQ